MLEILSELSESVKRGFEPHRSAKGTLHIATYNAQGEVVDAYLKITNTDVDVGIGFSGDPIASVTLRHDNAQLITEGKLDIRNPQSIESLNAIGSLAFIHAVSSMCTKTASDVKLKIKLAEIQTSQNPITTLKQFSGPPDYESIADCLANGQPAVFKECLDGEIHWDFGKIREKFGDCAYRGGTNGTIGALVDQMFSGEEVYSYGCKLPDGMYSDFSMPWLSDLPGENSPLQLWMGAASDTIVTGLHREVAIPFLLQVIGHKRLVLYSPDQHELVYAKKVFAGFQECWINQQEPNLEEFPLFEKANGIEVNLMPGELLLIPRGWFHCAYALTDVMSISTTIRY